MAASGYHMTIDSDVEDASGPAKTNPSRVDMEDQVDLSPEFVFDASGEPYVDVVVHDGDSEVMVQKVSC